MLDRTAKHRHVDVAEWRGGGGVATPVSDAGYRLSRRDYALPDRGPDLNHFAGDVGVGVRWVPGVMGWSSAGDWSINRLGGSGVVLRERRPMRWCVQPPHVHPPPFATQGRAGRITNRRARIPGMLDGLELHLAESLLGSVSTSWTTATPRTVRRAQDLLSTPSSPGRVP